MFYYGTSLSGTAKHSLRLHCTVLSKVGIECEAIVTKAHVEVPIEVSMQTFENGPVNKILSKLHSHSDISHT